MLGKNLASGLVSLVITFWQPGLVYCYAGTELSMITIRLPKGHTSKGLRGDRWGFNNFLAYDGDGDPMQIYASSSGAGNLSMMDHLWLDKDHDYFWAKVKSDVATIACATQGAKRLTISVKGRGDLEFTSPAVHWSDAGHRDGDAWSSAHNRPDHFQEWAYNVFTLSNPPSSRFSKFSKILDCRDEVWQPGLVYGYGNAGTEFSMITIRLPKGHTSKGLRGDRWGFNNFLAYDGNGDPMQIYASSSGAGDLSMMDHLWLDKDHEYFWAKVKSNVATIACATQGAKRLMISLKGPRDSEFISPAVHWSNDGHRDGDAWSPAHNRPDHFQKWAYNVFTLSNPPSSRFSKFSEILGHRDEVDKVRGELYLLLKKTTVDASFNIDTDKATRTFLSDVIADAYGLNTVSILSIEIARRLQAMETTKLRVSFAGVGVVTPTVSQSELSNWLQQHFGAYGWQLEGVSIEFEGNPATETPPDVAQSGLKIFVILLVTIFFFCDMVIGVFLVWRCHTRKRILTNTNVVPSGKSVEPNPIVVVPVVKKADNETTSEASNEASTKAPSSEDLSDVIV